MAASLVTQVRTAIEVPRWALGFYLRHFPLIFGVSLIPAAERFASQLWNTPQPAMEILTACARLVLLILVVRLAITRDPAVARSGEDGIGARVWRFYRLHWPSIIVQLLLL